MNKTNDGGNAFPLPLGTGNFSEPSESGGMTLRDYFAAKAMQSLIASRYVDYETGFYDEGIVANCAYAMADEMLIAREVTK